MEGKKGRCRELARDRKKITRERNADKEVQLPCAQYEDTWDWRRESSTFS
jgi:hypothetical protein